MSRTPGGPGRHRPGLLLVAALLAALLVARAAAASLVVPAVPYLPQPEALCGGAALAMVFRYWGLPNVRPEDFADSLNSEGTGIPAPELRRLAEARGFQAFAFVGGPREALSHLEKGRPLIALLETTRGRHHYVVVLAWANQRVLFHDPAFGPFRILSEAEWLRRWSATGEWALLVLPPDGLAIGQPSPPLPPPPQEEGPCADLVRPGVELALLGRTDEARQQLTAVASWCPTSSLPVREMAALEFRAEAFAAAVDLATEAVRRDPEDRFAWRLLAASRFLAGRREEALAAWNKLDEPRLDLVQVNGFERTPARVVYEYLDEEPKTMLTPERFRRVKRRIEALPASQLSRVSYRPQSGGTAQLEVNVVERPARISPRTLLFQSGVRALSERALGLDAFALAPSGDAVRLALQWQPHRSRGQLVVSAPRFLSLPGIVTADVLWDEQSYRLSPDTSDGPLLNERRKRASLALAHWWTADTRAGVTVAADEWRDKGRSFSLSGDVERRLLGDHVSVGGGAGGWWSLASAPFYTGSIRGSVRTRPTAERFRVRFDGAFDFASAKAPLALWSGAGTGSGRPALLRAHPLVRGGIIDGVGWGRRMLTASLQAEAPIASLGPARLRAAAFVDAAKVLAPAQGANLVDVGVGLRLQPPGWRSALRVDVATPWGGIHPILSAGWQGEWP